MRFIFSFIFLEMHQKHFEANVLFNSYDQSSPILDSFLLLSYDCSSSIFKISSSIDPFTSTITVNDIGDTQL